MLTNPEPRSRHLSLTSRRALIVLAACFAVLVQFAISPPSSRAEPDKDTLTIVGTSDVSDSGLSTVLIREFTKYYDTTHSGAISVGYKGEGSQAAITDAESGNGSALLVHAASLENQFVADGFSLEKYGRAVFHGDFVLLGPKTDPAGVDPGDRNNAVGAFEDIATAGAGGTANFISRSDGSGTNVEEHLIWQDSDVNGCIVDPSNGGGTTPSTTTNGDPCPQPAPSWYQAQDDHSQSMNVEATNACTGLPGSSASPDGDCYTITDRGTYDYLEAQNLIPNLKIVTEDNATSAPGNNTLLVNSFHAYAVNPAKVPSTSDLNPGLAESFIKWLSSPAGQDVANSYLAGAKGGAPFLKDAAPRLTASSLPKTVKGGKKITVKGTLTNVVPGTPALSKKRVTLSALRTSVARSNPKALPVKVKSALTNAEGHYSISFRPVADARYTVSTKEIAKLENKTLSPPFGDLLSPASRSLGRMNVRGSIVIDHVAVHGDTVSAKASVAPAPTNAFGHVSVYAGRSGHKLRFISKQFVKAQKKTVVVHFTLPRGFAGRFRLKYVNKGHITSGKSASRSVTVH